MGSYRHLSPEDREQIAVLRAACHSNAGIAVALGRAPSTISREVRRNALDSGRYSARTADGAYLLRRQRSALLERDKRLARFVRDRLTEGWSPQQISGWLQSGAELGLRAVAMETVYAFLYRAGQKDEQLWRYLARRHKRRRRSAARPSRDRIKDRVSIHERPENINDRSEIGHWEGDLIICQRTRPVLVLHERKTRLTLAARLTGKGAAETASVIMAILRRLDPRLRQSITFDNDTAFARHTLLRDALEMTTWFCDAYASWQKGGIENANGRLRRWLPRQTNIDNLADEDLQEIVMTYNLTPRKCLGYITPIQALFKELGRDVRLRFA
ncbi:MAG: IS30 family transposase [Proteobacteria bacterium]|nr:IS30 family transposase [Pseudomonadota bacterium]